MTLAGSLFADNGPQVVLNEDHDLHISIIYVTLVHLL